MSFNKLTPAQAERLALLAEECGELVQAIGKVLRHGYDSRHPDADDGWTNKDDVEKECGDVIASICILEDADDTNRHMRDCHFKRKMEKVGEFLHHAKVEP